MAFWGTEVRPGKPYTHVHDSTRGRLRVSQATLGNGKSTGKSVVQCNVGSKSPVLLCSLLPNVSETSHLELEFEEDDEVVFSVIGQRSIHLSGYFLGSRNITGGDDTDSYGEDIAETDTGSEDGMYDTDDDYESDFIDDGDLEMLPSPRRRSSVVIEEISEDEKPANGNAKRRHLKKKRQVSDSDDGNAESRGQLVVKGNRSAILESEDEDGFPILVNSKENNAVKNNEENATADDIKDMDRKRKIDDISQVDSGSAREHCELSDVSTQPGVGNGAAEKPKKKKGKERKHPEGGLKSSIEESTGVDKKQVPCNEDDCIPSGDSTQPGKANIDVNEKDLAVGLDGAENVQVQKKKKERVKKARVSETGIGLSSEKNDSKSQIDPDEDLRVSETGIGLSSEKNDSKSQIDPDEDLRVSETGIGLSSEKNDSKSQIGQNEDLNNENVDQDLPCSAEPEKFAIEKDVDPSIVESSGKLKKRKKKKKAKAEAQDKDHVMKSGKVDTNDEPQKSEGDEKMDEDLMVTQPHNDNHTEVIVDPVADAVDEGGTKDKKKKKKKNKKSEEDLNTNKESAGMPALQRREFPNGLVIEELSMGKPDAKRASPGNRVSVHYVGKLKNGEVFDSTTGGKPYHFRLGVGQVIKGWDVGVAGMRVGDKRRLTIPPSMGYPEENGSIVANSWLVFDVELVNVKGGR